MRSKEEVDGAINNLNFIVVTDIYDNEVSIDKTKVINEYNQSLGIALDYTRKLEELPNKIRDKIKLYELEIETLKTLYPKSYTEDDEYKLYVIKIQELKSIIGE